MNYKSVLLISLVATMFFASCTNVKEDIVGTWNFQTFDTLPQGTLTWTFKDDGSLLRVLTNNTGMEFDTCKYEIDKSIFNTKVIIKESTPMAGYDHVNGTFKIEKFKDDILVMTRIKTSDDEKDGAYLRCEMIRKQ